MNIATALNRRYVNYTIVMLTSLCINNPEHIDAYLMHNELIDDDIILMRRNLKNYDIDIIPIYIDRNMLPDNLITNEQWSIETYFRLLMIDILPESVDRILYLDVDTIVHKNISELFNIDFNGNFICAAPDCNGMTESLGIFKEKQKEMFSPFLKKGFIYFNAGVMLYNMESIREIYNFDSYLKAMYEWEFQIPANDQDILNYVYHDKVLYIPWEKYDLFAHLAYYNGISRDGAEKASIIHFSGLKPWDASTIHFDTEAIWWNYAKKTDIYYDLADKYIMQMTSDRKLELYNTYLLNKISEQQNTINNLIAASQELIEKLK